MRSLGLASTVAAVMATALVPAAAFGQPDTPCHVPNFLDTLGKLDPECAVGPDHLIGVTNNEISWSDKPCGTRVVETLADFFPATVGPTESRRVFDPEVHANGSRILVIPASLPRVT